MLPNMHKSALKECLKRFIIASNTLWLIEVTAKEK